VIKYIKNTLSIFGSREFEGWGLKRSGRFAKWCYEHFGGKLTLKEDGFIRSVGLGVNNSPSFSIVEDDIGIYYDATKPSKLENILNSYDFKSDKELLELAKRAIELIKEKKISKYNQGSLTLPSYIKKGKKNILIVAQTKNDASLKYGLANNFKPNEMILTAIRENPNANIYLKIHPDVLSGKKESNIDLNYAKKHLKIIKEDINPIVLLEAFDKVYTQTSQMGFEALLLGKEVICFGMPFYAGWGLSCDKLECKRRKRRLSLIELFSGAYVLYPKYFNPYSQKPSNILDTIKTIDRYRDIYAKNNGKLYLFGFSWWKRGFIKSYFPPLNQNEFYFCRDLNSAKAKNLDSNSKILIWGKREFKEVEEHSKKFKIPLYRVEDGFIRSVSLGSDLTKAYSLVVDTKGIYFDPTSRSDLEELLNSFECDSELIERSKRLQRYLIEKKISKYNINKDAKITLKDYKKGQKIILAVGQVEDDASIIYGANGMSNLELIKRVREKNPLEYIIYKPHPDVLAGNRKGNILEDEALKYVDLIVTNYSIDSVLEVASEVHTITSLVGFEALIRGKKVYTYGVPFYAGWGLSIDERVCKRRLKRRSLDELVAISLIIYPRYLNPKSNRLCEVEALLEYIEKEKSRYNNDKFFRYKTDIRNFISRKIQQLIRINGA